MADALHVLQHALGLDCYGQGASYRNHFVTGPGSADHAACLELVASGLMTRSAGSLISGGMDVFNVTSAGRAHVCNSSPTPPRKTRSQLRYARYLDADSNLPFGEWLRRSPGAIDGEQPETP